MEGGGWWEEESGGRRRGRRRGWEEREVDGEEEGEEEGGGRKGNVNEIAHTKSQYPKLHQKQCVESAYMWNDLIGQYTCAYIHICNSELTNHIATRTACR